MSAAVALAVSAAVIGTITSVAGALVNGQNQAAMAQAQAKANAQNFEFQSQAQQYQATIDKQNADAAHAQAAQEEDAQRRRFRALQAQSIAGMAQSGTDPTSGSNVDMLEQNSLFSELDSLNIRYQGEQKARGLLSQSAMDTWNSNISQVNKSNAIATGNMTASSALTGSYFNAGAGLMSGLSNAYVVSKVK